MFTPWTFVLVKKVFASSPEVYESPNTTTTWFPWAGVRDGGSSAGAGVFPSATSANETDGHDVGVGVRRDRAHQGEQDERIQRARRPSGTADPDRHATEGHERNAEAVAGPGVDPPHQVAVDHLLGQQAQPDR